MIKEKIVELLTDWSDPWASTRTSCYPPMWLEQPSRATSSFSRNPSCRCRSPCRSPHQKRSRCAPDSRLAASWVPPTWGPPCRPRRATKSRKRLPCRRMDELTPRNPYLFVPDSISNLYYFNPKEINFNKPKKVFFFFASFFFFLRDR